MVSGHPFYKLRTLFIDAAEQPNTVQDSETGLTGSLNRNHLHIPSRNTRDDSAKCSCGNGDGEARQANSRGLPKCVTSADKVLQTSNGMPSKKFSDFRGL